MPEGIDNLIDFGEPLYVNLQPEVADKVRSMAILDSCSPHELVRRALSYYDNNQELEREGWTGPTYTRIVPGEDDPETIGRKLSRLIIGRETEAIIIRTNFTPDVPNENG